MEEKLSIRDRLQHAWNVWKIKDKPISNSIAPSSDKSYFAYGPGSTSRPDRPLIRRSSERTIVSSIYTQIAIDVASVPLRHVKVNQNGSYVETVDSGLNRCLNIEANTDQTGREFIMDAVISMFDEGAVALVPIETNISLTDNNSFDILSLRTGKITQWYPKHVNVLVYNERTGNKEEILLPKSKVAIIQNPFYSVMNEPNSTIKRLIEKLNLLDYFDREAYDSSSLNLIVQLPYTVRSETQQKRADDRLDSIETQLKDSSRGIAYIDSAEKIIQLNRSLESQLPQQIEKLETKMYSDIGIPRSVFEGTADEQTMLNYRNNMVEPILSAIVDEMVRKFLTKTAQTQGQTIEFIQDPFKLVPVNNIADIADKFTRNEILSSNEVRSIVGYKPVADERANELRNKNLNVSDHQLENPLLADTE